MSRRTSMLVGMDTLLTALTLVVLVFITPVWIPLQLARDVYQLSTSVTAIVFSVFVASLAIIVASSDNEFVRFLEENGYFTDILFGFKCTLIALFASLMFTAALFILAAAQLSGAMTHQHRIGVLLAAMLFVYSLFSTLSTVFAALRYAELRARFLRAK